MKRNRKFNFKVHKNIIETDGKNTYYSFIPDVALIHEARRIALLNNCEFVKLRSGPEYDDRTVVVKGNSKDFVKFAVDFSLNFMENITQMDF